MTIVDSCVDKFDKVDKLSVTLNTCNTHHPAQGNVKLTRSNDDAEKDDKEGKSLTCENDDY